MWFLLALLAGCPASHDTSKESDCDGSNPAFYVGGVDRCGDGIDGDCDGVVDNNCHNCTFIFPGEAASLQDAVDAVADGDVICVAAGTYAVNLRVQTGGVTILGVHGPADTILETGGSDSVVTFSGDVEDIAHLEGFTIQNGVATSGGGILVEGASPALTDLVLADNSAETGGGIGVSGGEPTLTDVVLRGNRAEGAEYANNGGGIYAVDAELTLTGVDIHDNVAATSGGGIFATNTSLRVNNSRIVGNTANNGLGGGAYMNELGSHFKNVLIADNSGMGGGGGLSAVWSGIELENAELSRNVDFRGGAGVNLYESSLTARNAIITENIVSPADGAGVYADKSSVTLTYTDIWGNVPTDFVGFESPVGVDGNLSVDPLFLDDGAHLDASSPLVDAGDPSRVDPDGGPSDLGIFGGPGAASWDMDHDGFMSWWAPGPYDPASGLDCDDDDATVFPGAGC